MKTRKLLTTVSVIVVGLAVAVLASCVPTELSSAFSYQGVLTDSGGGAVADGDYEVAFRLYDAASNGNEVYAITRTVTTKNGVFSAVLSPPVEEMDDPLWVDLTVEGEQLPNRQRLLGAPYALSLVPGATIDGYVHTTDPVSATLNIANAGTGIGLAVLQANAADTGGNAILAVNNNGGDDVATLRISNNQVDGRMIEAYNGNGSDQPFSDREFSVRGNGAAYSDVGFFGTGGDYADMLPVADHVEPGDVLVIGPDGHLVRSTAAGATNVAGVYSTFPGFVGGDPNNNTDEGDPEMQALMDSLPELMRDLELDRVPVALAGVVPCKATAQNGPIEPGDLLVTSDRAGHAMRAEPISVEGAEFYPPGTILGKALEPLDEGAGVILILISLN